MELYFSEYFEVEPDLLERYGAFDISLVSDLPLFIDPFLLFHSEKEDYQALHDEIIKYLIFLRDNAAMDLDQGLIDNWYRFKEVKQNWLGFTEFGNSGRALGPKFAEQLHKALIGIFSDFGEENEVTDGSHLEKLALIRGGVGRDSISDLATNLIKFWLLEYTETFAKAHIDPKHRAMFSVPRARFNYETQAWETRTYLLPSVRGDFVLLTPIDILTRDDTWISHQDMVSQFHRLPAALEDQQLRAQVNNYFRSLLSRRPSASERRAAAIKTIERHPELLDYYIKLREDNGDRARSVSTSKVENTLRLLVEQVQALIGNLSTNTDFYDKNWTSYDEVRARVQFFKDYIENQDGYKLINTANGAVKTEAEVQLFFGLVWMGSDFDLNREPNNGRGPVDFKASFGSGDKSLIEFKLGSNSHLKRNLQKQVKIYEAANKTPTSVKVIVCYTVQQDRRVTKILRELKLEQDDSIVVIDARRDNKPSASKA